jgi:uncharacterized membrane protein
MDPVQNQTPEETTPAPAPAQTTPASSTPTAEKNTAMGVLAYLGPLVFVPLLTEKNDPFVKYHVKQGLVLLVIEVAALFVLDDIFRLRMISDLIILGCLVLTVIGILTVVKGEEKELPLIGQFSKYFKL